jgi:hypothetical protein
LSDIPIPSDANVFQPSGGENLTMALTTVGTIYKNCELFPVYKMTARQMLEKAIMRCDAKAMCNLGQMKMRGDGIRTDMARDIVVPEGCRPWHL